MIVRKTDFYLLEFAGKNRDASRLPFILSDDVMKCHVEQCLKRIFPLSLKLLRSYTEDDLDHNYIINVIAERPYPNDLGDKFGLCEVLEGNRLVKFVVCMEYYDFNLFDDEKFSPFQFEDALRRFITRPARFFVGKVAETSPSLE